MSDRGAALRIILTLGLGLASVACGHPEKKVVDQYFTAVNQQDNQTLASFSAVSFNKKVEDWKISAVSAEQRGAAQLPELAKKVTETELAIADNKKAYNAYFLDHPKEVDQVRELLKKNAAIPGNLRKYGDDWKAFTEKERELKKQLGAAKQAVEREKRDVALSLGQMEDVESLSGEMLSKNVDLTLTIGGQAQEYVMTLRKYDLAGTAGAGRVVSRWFVHDLKPKG